jgi:hypothetical protein
LYVPLPLEPEQERSNPQQRSFGTIDTWRELPDGAAYLETARDNTSLFASGTRTLSYGALLRQEVPARAKPGDLPFESARLDSPLPLENAETLGDLVKAAGTACRLELYADARLAVLPVTILRDGPIRSGDALRALSLAVTGAFRKVSSDGETAYVLSDDVEGLGTRQTRLSAWSRAAGARASAEVPPCRRACPTIQFTVLPTAITLLHSPHEPCSRPASARPFALPPPAALPCTFRWGLRTSSACCKPATETRKTNNNRIGRVCPITKRAPRRTRRRAETAPRPTASRFWMRYAARPSPATFPLIRLA